MEINDILGLGKVLPIDKLIDIVSKSVGRISKPYFDRRDIDTKVYEIKKMAEARAEEMKIISSAVKENFQLTGGIEYKEEKLVISSPKILPNESQPTILLTPSIEERAQERLTFQEAKKQLNIENITTFAAEELKHEQAVTDEPLDEDWTTRFFRIAEDISNEEMQALWGKILAGEVKQPKSYSLRTLELIRNLTKDEANLFMKVANFSVNSGIDNFIFKGAENELNKNYNIKYGDIAHLIEIGLIQPGDFVNYQLLQNEKYSTTSFISGNYVLIVTIKANTPTVQFPIHLFTHSGNELLKLVVTTPPFEYLTSLSKAIKRDGVEVKYGQILDKSLTHIQHTTPLQEFPLT